MSIATTTATRTPENIPPTPAIVVTMFIGGTWSTLLFLAPAIELEAII